MPDLPSAVSADGLVRVPGIGMVMDGRAAGRQAIELLKAKSGLAAGEVAEQAEEFGRLFRAELQSLAGSELSPAVHALAQMAIDMMAVVYRAQLLAGAAFGQWSEAFLDQAASTALNERADKAQRNLAGLCIVSRDLLLSARQAAIAHRTEHTVNPVDGLRARLGMNTTGSSAGTDVLPSVPVCPPGVGAQGAPLPFNSESPPNSGAPK